MLSIPRRSITPVTDKPVHPPPSIRNRGTNRNEFRDRYNRVIRDTTYQLNEFPKFFLSLSLLFRETLFNTTGRSHPSISIHPSAENTLTRYESNRRSKELKKVERRTLSSSTSILEDASSLKVLEIIALVVKSSLVYPLCSSWLRCLVFMEAGFHLVDTIRKEILKLFEHNFRRNIVENYK